MTTGPSVQPLPEDAPIEQAESSVIFIEEHEQGTWLQNIQQYLQSHLVGTISASVLVTLALTGTSAWNIWRINQGLNTTISKEFELQELSGSIVHLDEVLTMSARMGASTGDTRWEDRYNQFVPKLDKAINSLLTQVPVADQSNPEQTDEANKKLVDMEVQAFELVNQQKAPEALALLLGSEYEAQKKIYNDGIQGTLQTVRDNVKTQLGSYQQRLTWSFSFAIISLAVSALTWYVVLLAVQGYIRERKLSQATLESSKIDLQTLNEQLETQLEQQSIQEEKILAEGELFQEDVGHILDVVSAIEYGDLTIEAEVNDRATGLISDTLNRLIESLHRIMSVVSTTASQIANNTQELETLAIETNERAESQTQSVTDVRSLMENVNTLTTNSRQQATTTENALELAKAAVETGQQEMNAMVQGIFTLEEGTEQIVRRTQLLNDFVDLAAQFSKDQKRVASLTRVLALNASMLSTRALKEKDPAQFASIAKEFETLSRQVNDLAAETNQTLAQLQQRTDQIQTVTSGLTQDVDDINQLVNKFTDEVGKSRQAFTKMQDATDQVALAGQQVRQANDDIFEAVQSTLIATQTIAREAEDTAFQANTTQKQVAAMGELADNLANMVEFFQLRTVTEDSLSPVTVDSDLPSANLPLTISAES